MISSLHDHRKSILNHVGIPSLSQVTTHVIEITSFTVHQQGKKFSGKSSHYELLELIQTNII